jgi:hypothetical protein
MKKTGIRRKMFIIEANFTYLAAAALEKRLPIFRPPAVSRRGIIKIFPARETAGDGKIAYSLFTVTSSGPSQVPF